MFKIDRPHEKEAVIHIPKCGQALGISTESQAADTNRMLVQNRKRDVRRGIFSRGKNQDPWVVASLEDVSERSCPE